MVISAQKMTIELIFCNSPELSFTYYFLEMFLYLEENLLHH